MFSNDFCRSPLILASRSLGTCRSGKPAPTSNGACLSNRLHCPHPTAGERLPVRQGHRAGQLGTNYIARGTPSTPGTTGTWRQWPQLAITYHQPAHHKCCTQRYPRVKVGDTILGAPLRMAVGTVLDQSTMPANGYIMPQYFLPSWEIKLVRIEHGEAHNSRWSPSSHSAI